MVGSVYCVFLILLMGFNWLENMPLLTSMKRRFGRDGALSIGKDKSQGSILPIPNTIRSLTPRVVRLPLPYREYAQAMQLRLPLALQ